MFSPLLQTIIERENYPVLTNDTLDSFLAENEDVILLVAGAHERIVEVNDVAVIYPELLKAFTGRLTPAIIDRASERGVQLRYRFNAFPSLIFLRKGGYLGTISKLLDWQDYLTEISEILSRTPTNAPAFQFPEGCLTTSAETTPQSNPR